MPYSTSEKIKTYAVYTAYIYTVQIQKIKIRTRLHLGRLRYNGGKAARNQMACPLSRPTAPNPLHLPTCNACRQPADVCRPRLDMFNPALGRATRRQTRLAPGHVIHLGVRQTVQRTPHRDVQHPGMADETVRQGQPVSVGLRGRDRTLHLLGTANPNQPARANR